MYSMSVGGLRSQMFQKSCTVGRRFLVNGSIVLNSGKAKKFTEEAGPDASATYGAELHEHQRVSIGHPENAVATWLNALHERKKQLAQGKVIDSYTYSHLNSTELTDKTREESFQYVMLPFKDDPAVADFYVNAAGRIKMGQLFQDLDSLAGKIAYKHTSPTEPVIVTASVDRIYLLKPIESIDKCNILLSGSVIYTGRSSMEIAITARAVTKKIEGKITESQLTDDNIFLTASFTFVARNPETHKSIEINKLLPLNENQWIDFRRAESRMAAKKLMAVKSSLEKNPPTSEESQIIHKLWTASRKIIAMDKRPANFMFMKETTVKSTMFMQPQYRNRHSYMIFGGYLMRQTFELAYCSAAAFSHAFPRFVSLDSTTFKTPVPVGSILHMAATVVYTENLHGNKPPVKKTIITPIDKQAKPEFDLSQYQPPPVNEMAISREDFMSKPGTLIQVKVDTSVQELASSSVRPSGSFIFSFFVPKESDEINRDVDFTAVVPETYSEMIEYIEGRRRATETAMNTKKQKITPPVKK